MKIRNGFVSNSSSSSFIMFGKIVTPKEALKLLENGKELRIPSDHIINDDVRFVEANKKNLEYIEEKYFGKYCPYIIYHIEYETAGDCMRDIIINEDIILTAGTEVWFGDKSYHTIYDLKEDIC